MSVFLFANQTIVGDMAPTLLTQFCSSQNLSNLMSNLPFSSPLRPFASKFAHVFESDRRSIFAGAPCHSSLNDSDVGDLQQLEVPSNSVHDGVEAFKEHLDSDVEDAIRSWFGGRGVKLPDKPTKIRVRSLTKIHEAGSVYKPWKEAPADSNVIFKYLGHSNREVHWSAGRISQILRCPSRVDSERKIETLIVVQEYLPLDAESAAKDPCRRYSFNAAGCLYFNSLLGPVVLQVDDIICHFCLAETQIDGLQLNSPYVQIMPWNTVSVAFHSE